MITCYICSAASADTAGYFQHLKTSHFSFNQPSIFKCVQTDCMRDFQEFKSFKKHMQKKHEPFIARNQIANNSTNVAEIFRNHAEANALNSEVDESENPDMEIDSDSTTTVNTAEIRSNMTKSAAMFLAQLHANNAVNRKTVQTVIEGLNETLLSGALLDLKREVLKVMQNANCDETTVHNILDIFNICSSPFDMLDTEHKRLKYYEENGFYTPPIEYTIDSRLEFIPSAGNIELKEVSYRGQYVTLFNTLKKMLSLPGSLKTVLDHIANLKSSNVFQNIIQGAFWKKKEQAFAGKIVMPLLIYFDDFTYDNPLGSHKGKMGAVYYTIACLPQELQAKLEHLYLAMLFKAEDRQKFGNLKTFSPLISELTLLEKSGIEICCAEYPDPVTIYFSVALIIGDNLGLHGILGFTECFNSHICCRFCKAPKAVFQKSFSIDPKYCRTIEGYESDILLSDPSLTGIKELCVFNEIPSFHVIENTAVDVMHDFYEGVCRYVMAVLILKLMSKGFFTLDKLNTRISSFDYGPQEISNKPAYIKIEKMKNYNLGLTASEMIFLVRYFGVMVGDLVPKENQEWKIYLRLRQISNIIMSRVVTDDNANLLDVLVSELSEIFYNDFKEHLRFKFHVLCHYGEIMKSVGPVVNIWCMRFEGKHKEIQSAAKISSNRKNTPLSLAIAQQLKLNYVLLSNKGYRSKSLSVSEGHPIGYDEVQKYNSHELLENSHLIDIKWTSINNFTYFKGSFVMTGHNETKDLPLFSEVIKIIFSNSEKIFFVCKRFKTKAWIDHIHAFKILPVKTDVPLTIIAFDDLCSNEPLHARYFYDGMKYIVLRNYA